MPNALRQAARSLNVCVRFTPAERQRLERAAHAAGARTLSDWIRGVALGTARRLVRQAEGKVVVTRREAAALVAQREHLFPRSLAEVSAGGAGATHGDDL